MTQGSGIDAKMDRQDGYGPSGNSNTSSGMDKAPNFGGTGPSQLGFGQAAAMNYTKDYQAGYTPQESFNRMTTGRNLDGSIVDRSIDVKYGALAKELGVTPLSLKRVM